MKRYIPIISIVAVVLLVAFAGVSSSPTGLAASKCSQVECGPGQKVFFIHAQPGKAFSQGACVCGRMTRQGSQTRILYNTDNSFPVRRSIVPAQYRLA